MTALSWVLPHRLLSALARSAAYSTHPWLKQALIDTVTRRFGVDLAEAARMASLYPAQCLRVDDRYGRIVAGHRADMVLLDADLRVRDTWIGGTAA